MTDQALTAASEDCLSDSRSDHRKMPCISLGALPCLLFLGEEQLTALPDDGFGFLGLQEQHVHESAESMMVASSYCNDKQCTNCGLKGRTTQYQMVSQTVFNTDAVRYTGGRSDKAEVSKLQRQRQSQQQKAHNTQEICTRRNRQDTYR